MLSVHDRQNLSVQSYLSNLVQFVNEYGVGNVIGNDKVEFRYFCYRYLNYIRTITIPDIYLDLSKEAVLIEPRTFPHVEFIIRNAILKMGSSWSYTVICGTENHEFMVNLCKTIHKNIRVIMSPYNNLTPSDYSLYLASSAFWEQLHGDKILIYQEDSCIFRKNIDDFLHCDYIGAAWPKTNNDTPNLVGNGGFSLRSRQCMLDVIAARHIMNTSYNSSTIRYMNENKLTVPPEDVYFSKTMQEFGIGRVGTWEEAVRFSTESVNDINSVGGHNFWMADKEWRQRLFQNNVIQCRYSFIKEEAHRGGWPSILKNFVSNDLLSYSGQWEFIDMIEKEFLWINGNIITNPWCGIVHCAPNTLPPYLKNCDITHIFKNGKFIHSLPQCKLLIVLSNSIKQYFDSMFSILKFNIPVVMLKHPVVSENIPLFDYNSYIQNPSKKLIQIGQQLRKMSSIYMLDVSGHDKLWLTGNKNFDILIKTLNIETAYLNLPTIKKPKTLMYYTQTYEEYDDLLTKNIVFIDLWDSAANNTVLECIVRNTPVILNRTDGVVEYLGADYPLFFNTHDEVQALLSEDKLLAAHTYLSNMNKDDITIDYFTRRVGNLMYNAFTNLTA